MRTGGAFSPAPVSTSTTRRGVRPRGGLAADRFLVRPGVGRKMPGVSRDTAAGSDGHAGQVRQPLYARSVGRWRRYAKELGSWLRELDAHTFDRVQTHS